MVFLEELGVEMLFPLLTLSLIRKAYGPQVRHGREIPKVSCSNISPQKLDSNLKEKGKIEPMEKVERKSR